MLIHAVCYILLIIYYFSCAGYVVICLIVRLSMTEFKTETEFLEASINREEKNVQELENLFGTQMFTFIHWALFSD